MVRSQHTVVEELHQDGFLGMISGIQSDINHVYYFFSAIIQYLCGAELPH